MVEPQQAVSHSATCGRTVERRKVHKLIPSPAIVFHFVCNLQCVLELIQS